MAAWIRIVADALSRPERPKGANHTICAADASASDGQSASPCSFGDLVQIHFPPALFCATIPAPHHFFEESERTHAYIHTGPCRILWYLLAGLWRLRISPLRRRLPSTGNRICGRRSRL